MSKSVRARRVAQWRILVAFLFVAATTSASVSHAVFYGTLGGSDFTFENVSGTHGLFGLPSVSGNQFDFGPSSFDAECPFDPDCGIGGGIVTVDDTLTMDIVANPGAASKISTSACSAT